METKGGKKKSSSGSSSNRNNRQQYEAPVGYSIEDIRPNGGIEKFRSAAYSIEGVVYRTYKGIPRGCAVRTTRNVYKNKVGVGVGSLKAGEECDFELARPCL